MVDFGLIQGRRDFKNRVVVGLRRDFYNPENEVLSQMVLFLDGDLIVIVARIILCLIRIRIITVQHIFFVI